MNRSRILKVSVLLICVLTACAALATAYVFSSLPKTEGKIVVSGLFSPVSITRDAGEEDQHAAQGYRVERGDAE